MNIQESANKQIVLVVVIILAEKTITTMDLFHNIKFILGALPLMNMPNYF